MINILANTSKQMTLPVCLVLSRIENILEKIIIINHNFMDKLLWQDVRYYKVLPLVKQSLEISLNEERFDIYGVR